MGCPMLCTNSQASIQVDQCQGCSFGLWSWGRTPVSPVLCRSLSHARRRRRGPGLPAGRRPGRPGPGRGPAHLAVYLGSGGRCATRGRGPPGRRPRPAALRRTAAAATPGPLPRGLRPARPGGCGASPGLRLLVGQRRLLNGKEGQGALVGWVQTPWLLSFRGEMPPVHILFGF